ncbi:MAG: class I SAM-dependent methyltransferase [Spirochaetales bacterium]|nr:class I SAM-dependent methyltransferase [Spirochaetales bacterium]MCF7937814.1 class I SAM-dependent methyltransferase [Spirochaetales bacterium]
MDNEKWNERYRMKAGEDPRGHSIILEEQTADLAPRKALDLAAGDGRNAFFLARQGWQVTAVDFSDVAVERGKRIAEEMGLTITWEIQDLVSFIPRQKSYDLVSLFYLHLPWESFRLVLQHAADAVREGGRLLVVGHDLSNLEEGTGGPQNPEVLYRPQDITGELDSLPSLRIEYAEKIRRASDHGDEKRGSTQIDGVVRAMRR